jgi:ABC-type multidrug transport system fused ATPase/permease subunit
LLQYSFKKFKWNTKNIKYLLLKFLRAFFHVATTVIMISLQTPWFLLALSVLSVIYIIVQVSYTLVYYVLKFCAQILTGILKKNQRYYVTSSRQLRRLDLVSRSPVFSHVDETLTGVSVIRAYKAEPRFVQEMQMRFNENLIFFYPEIVSHRWLGVRLAFIGSLITLFASIFAVVGRNHLTGGAAGLSISYSLRISQLLNWLVR